MKNDGQYLYSAACSRKGNRGKEGKLFAFFTDLKAAFDRVDRSKLWEAMKKTDIFEGLIEKIQESYTETKSKMKIKNETSEEFGIYEGVRL